RARRSSRMRTPRLDPMTSGWVTHASPRAARRRRRRLARRGRELRRSRQATAAAPSPASPDPTCAVRGSRQALRRPVSPLSLLSPAIPPTSEILVLTITRKGVDLNPSPEGFEGVRALAAKEEAVPSRRPPRRQGQERARLPLVASVVVAPVLQRLLLRRRDPGHEEDEDEDERRGDEAGPSV